MKTLLLFLIAALVLPVTAGAYAVDSITPTTVRVTGLTCNKQYRIRVEVRNSSNTGWTGLQTFTPTTAACDPPPPPADTDGDGVPDSSDLCPNTPIGTTVDSTGCPITPPTGFPDASNTGAGTNLTAYTGPTNITTANTVIDSKNITSCLLISAPGVVIKNSKINCTNSYVIYNNSTEPYHSGYSGTGLTLQDDTISCLNGSGAATNGTAVGDNNLTATRLNIFGCENGFDLDLNGTVQDSYIHDMFQSDQAHVDDIQSYDGTGVHILHNTLWPDTYPCSNSNCTGNSSITVNNNNATVIHTNGLDIENNLIGGGTVPLYCPRASTIGTKIIGNHFSYRWRDPINGNGTGSSDGPPPWLPLGNNVGSGAYGVSADCQDEAMISGNVFDETGLPVILE